jgi:uncharacterized protein (DUF58 family)
MLPQDILKQIRRLQVKARRAVDNVLGGEYHSVFKGAGIVFEEVREYLPGDDIRSIDWNVTARTGHPYVKRFVEEREQTLMLVVDCSGSLKFGTGNQQKREVAAEMAAVLAFSAIANNDRVGLIQITDRVERFIPPRKGTRHVLRLIREILFFQPEHRGTSLKAGLDYLNRILRRRVIVFLMSDFLDEGFDQPYKRAGRRHDLVAIRITDPREESLPPVGLLEMEDAETGQRVVIDTGSRKVREQYEAKACRRRDGFRQLARAAGTDVIEVTTEGKHFDALLRFFRLRELRQRTHP